MRKLIFNRYSAVLCGIMMILFYFSLPRQLFHPTYSTILEDRDGNLLGARIAGDGQWRFPPEGGLDTLSAKYVAALVAYEDRYFFRHFGVNLRSLARATRNNLRHRRVVSGASTITMQAISLYRGHKARNIFDKVWEIILAIRLECSYSKEEILRMYAAHAPFGGNTVGYGAATWRYFGKHNKDLTWAEAALLAVLPNNPALIHLGKNRTKLLEKRNNLLSRLADNGLFSKNDLTLYLEEPLPDKPFAMPNLAPHLLLSMQQATHRFFLKSSIDSRLQKRLSDLLINYGTVLKVNQVHNAAICVADIQSGDVLAYIGNIPHTGAIHGEQVDIIQSSRSTGSLLKPFLAMMAVQDGMVTTKSLLTDIPVNIDGFKPDNFTYDFEGVAPLDVSLRKSLNIPFVLLLKQYNIARCLNNLRLLGLNHLDKTADHYGLSLIIGGGESTLWELCGAYASCARILNFYTSHSGKYNPDSIHPLHFGHKDENEPQESSHPSVMDAGSVYLIFQALSENTRPDKFENWKDMAGSQRVAWKTGTSIGFRDAWSIGVTSRYVVGVWIGNADGEGRPGVIGLETAAPLLFSAFDLLPPSPWFVKPFDAIKKIPVCKNSSLSPGAACPVDSLEVPRCAHLLPLCSYDKRIALNKSGNFRVNSDCYSPFEMQFKDYFILSPAQQYYFSQKHPAYTQLPPFLPGCGSSSESRHPVMEFIYPNNIRKIYLPKDADGHINPVTFVVAHKSPDAILYWHLDDRFIGSTKGKNEMSTLIPAGFHTLTVVDDAGNSISTRFESSIAKK